MGGIEVLPARTSESNGFHNGLEWESERTRLTRKSFNFDEEIPRGHFETNFRGVETAKSALLIEGVKRGVDFGRQVIKGPYSRI